MSKIITMVILVSVIWQVVSSIIENAAKRKEQQRIRELAQRRRGAPETAVSAGDAAPRPELARASAPPTAAPSSPRMQTRAEELAARRQAQLEELRKRRSGQGRPTAPTQVRIAPQTPTSASQGIPTMQGRRGQPIVSRPADPASIRRAQEAERLRQLQVQRRRQQELLAAGQAEAREKTLADARRQAERAAALKRAAAARRAAAAPRGAGGVLLTPIDGRITSGRLQSLLRDRRSIRELFVLKELLDPPLATRNL
jgi:colicin import membrane protein